jgi:hypothetical protein
MQQKPTWVEQDSNLRRLSHQIYSLAPLAAWVSTRLEFCRRHVSDCHVMETRSNTRVIDTFLAKQSWR